MDTEKYSAGTCPIGRSLSRVGDAWSLMILRDAALGSTRFDQFQKSLGIAPNILTRRLSALVEAGVMEKHRYSERPPRDEYRLTACGRDLLPVLDVLAAWGTKHFGEGEVSVQIDAETGALLDPVVVDRSSGRPMAEIARRLVMPD